MGIRNSYFHHGHKWQPFCHCRYSLCKWEYILEPESIGIGSLVAWVKRWLQMVPPSVWTRKQEDRRFESVLSLTCYCNIRVDFTTNRQLEAFSSVSTQVSSTWKQAVNLCHYHFRAWNVEVAQYMLGWWKNRFGRHLNKVNFWSKFLIYDDNSRSVSLYSFRINFHWKT